MDMLKIGDRFPGIQVETMPGGTVRLPDDVSGEHAVVLFYRGKW